MIRSEWEYQNLSQFPTRLKPGNGDRALERVQEGNLFQPNPLRASWERRSGIGGMGREIMLEYFRFNGVKGR